MTGGGGSTSTYRTFGMLSGSTDSGARRLWGWLMTLVGRCCGFGIGLEADGTRESDACIGASSEQNLIDVLRRQDEKRSKLLSRQASLPLLFNKYDAPSAETAALQRAAGAGEGRTRDKWKKAAASASLRNKKSSTQSCCYSPTNNINGAVGDSAAGRAVNAAEIEVTRKKVTQKRSYSALPGKSDALGRTGSGTSRTSDSAVMGHASTLDRRSLTNLPTSSEPVSEQLGHPQGHHHQLPSHQLQQRSVSQLSSLGCRSDSMASVYSAGEARYGTVAVRGEVQLVLMYNHQMCSLEVLVKQCRELAAVDSKRNRSDPYVKLYLLPDRSKSGKRKTKTRKHTLAPVFEETLKFHASLSELNSRTLWLTVWHCDMFGRNDFLGELMLPVAGALHGDAAPRWYTLQERAEVVEEVSAHRGDVVVALKFVPPEPSVVKKSRRAAGTLYLLIKEAKGLVPVRASGSTDPFCKTYLLPERRSGKHKTSVARRTTSPCWSAASPFLYADVTVSELRHRCLELTVWDHGLTSNEFLGGVRLNLGTGEVNGRSVDWMDGAGQEISLWEQMLDRPGYWVEGSVPLRHSMEQPLPPPS